MAQAPEIVCNQVDKMLCSRPLCAGMAERVGFEPTVPETGTTVFETVAFNRSAISPSHGIIALGMSKPRLILRAVTLTVASRHPYDCREFGGGDEIGNGGKAPRRHPE